MKETTQTYQGIQSPAQPLAEFIAPELLTESMKRYETRRNPEGLFRSAWCHVEMGLSQRADLESNERQYLFETAQFLLGEINRRPDSHQDLILGSFVLASYMPLFKKRSLNQEINYDDCESIYQSLGEALGYLKPLSIDEPPQWRMTETAVLALSARTRQPHLMLYPTSPREEQSRDGSVNHDSYFYNGSNKVPLQQKLIRTDKSYAEWITILTLQPLIDKATRRLGDDRAIEAPLAEKVNYLLSLIVAETSGRTVTPKEKRFLDCMSTSIAAHHRLASARCTDIAA